MTNSKIRNFFETLRSIKEDVLLPYMYLKGRNFGGNLIWRLAKSAYLAGI